MKELLKESPACLTEYKQEQSKDPYQYVRQRNEFWGQAGSILTNLVTGYVFFGFIKGIIVLAFVVAVIKALCS